MWQCVPCAGSGTGEYVPGLGVVNKDRPCPRCDGKGVVK